MPTSPVETPIENKSLSALEFKVKLFTLFKMELVIKEEIELLIELAEEAIDAPTPMPSLLTIAAVPATSTILTLPNESKFTSVLFELPFMTELLISAEIVGLIVFKTKDPPTPRPGRSSTDSDAIPTPTAIS